MTHIEQLPTPALLLDVDVLDRNLEWMANRAQELGVSLRPHVKTHKCIEIAERQRAVGARGITVATLQEARDFAAEGFDDITWAFPLVLTRLDEAVELAERITLRVVVDSPIAVDALETTGRRFHVWLKVDSGYHRAGVDPQAEESLGLAQRIDTSPNLEFDGILTHAGHTYDGPTQIESGQVARQERDIMVDFADRLRGQGVRVNGLSVGSTPGMRAIDHLDGVNEARPGNYVFFDHTQVTLGACAVTDCAVTVLASVVSSHSARSHSIVDAGALALSKDPGRGDLPMPTMGEVFEDYSSGTLRADCRVVGTSQEHGHVNAALPVGNRVRILPNHSCLTAACFDEYHVVRGNEVIDRWKILRGR